MLVPVLLSGIVVFCSFTLEAITGFGCTVIALPFVTALLGMHEGVIIVTVLALLLAMWIAIRNFHDINFREFAKIIALVILGLPIGIFLSRTADVQLLKKTLAVFIIAVSVFQLTLIFLRHRKESRDPQEEAPGEKKKMPWYSYIALFLAGIVHGMFSSGGPLAILYTARALEDKKQFRATLCLLWTTLNIILVATYLIEGAITPAMGLNMLELLPFMLLGILAGEKIHRHVNAQTFTLLIFISLLITGIFMLI